MQSSGNSSKCNNEQSSKNNIHSAEDTEFTSTFLLSFNNLPLTSEDMLLKFFAFLCFSSLWMLESKNENNSNMFSLSFVMNPISNPPKLLIYCLRTLVHLIYQISQVFLNK
jgi:hypothetical protein